MTPPANSSESNPDLFKEILRYDNPIPYSGGGATNAQKNGNIAQVEWQVAGREGQVYSLLYDDLDRLTAANYTDIHSGNWG